jgi:hypothetical protein
MSRLRGLLVILNLSVSSWDLLIRVTLILHSLCFRSLIFFASIFKDQQISKLSISLPIYLCLNVFFLLVWVGVHGGICKCSYIKMSYLNSLPPSFSFIPSSPYSWNNFNRYHFSIYIHTCVHSICTIFTLLFPFPTSAPTPLVGIPRKNLFCTLFSYFVNKKTTDIFVCLR